MGDYFLEESTKEHDEKKEEEKDICQLYKDNLHKCLQNGNIKGALEVLESLPYNYVSDFIFILQSWNDSQVNLKPSINYLQRRFRYERPRTENTTVRIQDTEESNEIPVKDSIRKRTGIAIREILNFLRTAFI